MFLCEWGSCVVITIWHSKPNLEIFFLELVSKHFPRHHKMYPILNRKALKISYSCTANIKRIIQGQNKKVLKDMKKTTKEKECNCQASRKKDCPLNGKSNRRNAIYKATTQNPDLHFYIGVTENC